MLVLGMNPKRQRQRRTNVKLGEIGDVSASLSYKYFMKPQVENKRWDPEPEKTMAGSYLVSPRDTIDTHSWENLNPNPRKYDLGVEGTDMGNPNMGFGMVNRKRRLKKNRTWSMRSSGMVTSGWHCKFGPEVGEDNKKASEYDNSNCHFDNVYGHLGHEMWDKNGGSCYGNSTSSSLRKESNCTPLDGGRHDSIGNSKKLKAGSTLANGVNEWLVDLGFSKYAGLFEKHEVDEEALPLLTYEDLKEMGIIAVVTRRRIYTAIQLLSKGNGAR